MKLMLHVIHFVLANTAGDRVGHNATIIPGIARNDVADKK